MRLKSYPKMKDSGVEWIGEIPEHWKIAKIKFFCETNPSKNEVNNLPKDLEISFLPMEKIGVDGKLKLEEKRKLNEVVNGFTYFRNGDIIVAKITPCFENGKGSLCEGLENEIGFGTTELHVLRPKKELDSIFTYWWTRSNQFFQNGEASMYGAAGQKRISIEFIKNFKISYPESILEQREIGEFLKKHIEKTDEEIRKNKKSILLLKEKQQSLINQVVTKGLDPSVPMKDSCIDGIGNVPEYWDISKIKHNTTKINSGVTPKGGSESYLDNGIPLIRSQNIHFDGLHLDNVAYISSEINEQMKNSQIKDHDILLNITGASIGRCTYIPDNFGDGNVNQHVCIIRTSKKIDYKYLTMFFHTSQIQSLINGIQEGASRQGLTFHTIKNFDLLIPSIEEQKQIVDFLDIVIPKANNLIKKTSSQIKKLREYRESIITSAVTGKINLTNLAQ